MILFQLILTAKSDQSDDVTADRSNRML